MKHYKQRFINFTKESLRVLKVTKKPSGSEFKTIVKVSALGMLAIGLIGFLIQLLKLVFI
ncbi:protein translocase SEC61 complex subunit gamma [Candidatus Woesearchaeota archaeon]|nr:protein translocase SEC61 complex subunit gamma [Candidatus Woesearchaeota archaeon]